jgi:hypothetical protein
MYFFHRIKAKVQFDFSHFLADNIHDQLCMYSTEGIFRYSSVLVYLFLFFQSSSFPCAFHKLK